MWTPVFERDEVAARLLRLIPEVMKRWEGLARAEVPAAQKADRHSLRDHLPLFLEDLAQAIAIGRAEVCRDGAARIHTHQRAESQRYTLA